MHVAFVQTQNEYLKGSGQYAILGDDVAIELIIFVHRIWTVDEIPWCRNKSN
jgi:hypothetical protein